MSEKILQKSTEEAPWRRSTGIPYGEPDLPRNRLGKPHWCCQLELLTECSLHAELLSAELPALLPAAGTVYHLLLLLLVCLAAPFLHCHRLGGGGSPSPDERILETMMFGSEMRHQPHFWSQFLSKVKQHMTTLHYTIILYQYNQHLHYTIILHQYSQHLHYTII